MACLRDGSGRHIRPVGYVKLARSKSLRPERFVESLWSIVLLSVWGLPYLDFQDRYVRVWSRATRAFTRHLIWVSTLSKLSRSYSVRRVDTSVVDCLPNTATSRKYATSSDNTLGYIDHQNPQLVLRIYSHGWRANSCRLLVLWRRRAGFSKRDIDTYLRRIV